MRLIERANTEHASVWEDFGPQRAVREIMRRYLKPLLDLARSGDLKALESSLELETRETHATSTPGQSLSVEEQLLDEALWYARAGDLSEATYRLEQACQ